MKLIRITLFAVSLLAAGNCLSSPPDSTAKQGATGLFGVGPTFGARLFYPIQVNSFVEDIYNALPGGPANVQSKQSVPGLRLALFGRGKIMYYPIPYLAVEAFGGLSWSPKYFYLRSLSGGNDKSCYIYLLEVGGGLNAWARFKPMSKICPKIGFGALWTSSTLKVSGDVGTAHFSGNGITWQCLAGLDVSFRRFMVNIDICIPYASYSLYSNSIELDSNYSYRSPTKLEYYGIEIRPGFTYRF